MYAYHYQDVDYSLIFRYDNAAHRPARSQPEHKHTPSGIEEDRIFKRTFQVPRRHGSARGVDGEPRAAGQKEGAGRKGLI